VEEVKTERGQAPAAGQPVQQESIELPSLDRIQNLVRQARAEVVQEGGVVDEQAGGEEAQAAGPPVHGSAVRGAPAPHFLPPCRVTATLVIQIRRNLFSVQSYKNLSYLQKYFYRGTKK